MMASRNQDRWSNYGFVFSILWIGFVLAISLLETPLRFRPESVTLPLALEIGRLVFHGLNYTEIGLAVLILVMQCCSSPSRRSKITFGIAVAILLVQTVLLFLVLDPRTETIIAGHDAPPSAMHTIYIGLELVKIIALVFLTCYQIGDFKKRLIGEAGS